MAMGPDLEMRASTAIDAMRALSAMLDMQTPETSLPSSEIAPLVRLVFGAVQKALPSGFRPLNANDDEDDE